ncbi:uncharacterized protein LOC143211588 [Lasioglossum baleicum]|uniref:uncharacterized protein LOC143211588 n=1 Tax=Lasioglossum baleicum TaxID=434251 RepID=UPI003FCC405A
MDEPILSIPLTDKVNFNKMRHRKASGEVVTESISNSDLDQTIDEELSSFMLSDIELLRCALMVFKRRRDDVQKVFSYWFVKTPTIYGSELIDVDRQRNILLKGECLSKRFKNCIIIRTKLYEKNDKR